ncbi:trimeric intracellular cation channel type 1B.1 [Folsomia candida]|uniref:Trimeric intracellular cation channel type A n=1 Tax=Folsomia candida TaxID=158441 RepID=A0A226DC26_FOLCA|nr:trimeric intracellular cation channel type 1B.1 [Folsomia candida]OXA41796.1 Trimeric intracellular cation channel type A [Folsomia candida]
MDPEMFLEVANQVTKLKMFPYFDIAHAVLCCLHVREDLGANTHPFSRRHPLTTWICCIFEIFAGGMLASLFLGEPVLSPLKSNQHLLLYTAVWYVIFYCPFDAGYKISKFLPVKLTFSVLKEIYRVKKVYDGVTHSLKIYPSGYLIALIIGTIKGNGAGFCKIFERLLRGVWTPGAIEILQPSFPTKACIAASLIFLLDKKTEFISAPHSLLYFGIVVFFVYFKISSILLGIHDPFAPFENIFCALCMGGLADAITRAFGGSPGSSPSSATQKPTPSSPTPSPDVSSEKKKD